jgi:hypothetical protein
VLALALSLTALEYPCALATLVAIAWVVSCPCRAELVLSAVRCSSAAVLAPQDLAAL